MKGYIFVSPGSDPGVGKNLVDPILSPRPSMGACRPDLRRLVRPGDRIFVVSGSTKGVSQYVIGGFEIAEVLDALTAHAKFPENRLKLTPEGQKEGNIIVTPDGLHHPLDHHDEGNEARFARRIQNYLVGTNTIALMDPPEIDLGRARSLELLKEVFDKPHARDMRGVIGRNKKMNEIQIQRLHEGLRAIKAEAARVQPR